MEQLNRHFLSQQERRTDHLEVGCLNPGTYEKILQFGEGNFLRAFVDFFIDELNERGLFDGNVVIEHDTIE